METEDGLESYFETKIIKDKKIAYLNIKSFYTYTNEIKEAYCYFTHTMAIPTLIYKFYNSILSINLQAYTLKFPCT